VAGCQGWLGGRAEAMSEASPPLTASHRPPTQPNEPAHFLAQAEQHLGFRIVVQGFAIQAAGGRRGGQATGFGNGGMRRMTRAPQLGGAGAGGAGSRARAREGGRSKPEPHGLRRTLHQAPDDPIRIPTPPPAARRPLPGLHRRNSSSGGIQPRNRPGRPPPAARSPDSIDHDPGICVMTHSFFKVAAFPRPRSRCRIGLWGISSDRVRRLSFFQDDFAIDDAMAVSSGASGVAETIMSGRQALP
jgi:hypothetical protein